MSLAKLKWAAIISFFVAMAVLLGGGYFARDKVAPYPGKTVAPDGKILFEKSDIIAGQNVYQRYGLMDHGSVWGHGSQRGMEFSAVTLHMEGESVKKFIAGQEYGKEFEALDELEQEIVGLKTIREIKGNRYDPDKDVLALTASQVAGLQTTVEFWEKTFRNGDDRYGFLANTIPTAEERLQIGRFFFWTAWVASTNRPDKDYSFTNNWPPDKSVGNVATTAAYVWSIGGILSLFLVLGLFVFWVHHYGLWYGKVQGVALSEKLLDMPLTSSQFKAAKFFLVVILLFLLQTVFGGLLAHYTVHPSKFYLPFLADLIPYSWAKSWHLQLAIFWIATTWVASAIYLAPIIGGKEPKKQGLLVQLLFGAVLIVALGSLLGEV
ncbi:MAG: nitric-oxide reductase large subunit, partial [Candidatus Latescibacterota bacterium]